MSGFIVCKTTKIASVAYKNRYDKGFQRQLIVRCENFESVQVSLPFWNLPGFVYLQLYERGDLTMPIKKHVHELS